MRAKSGLLATAAVLLGGCMLGPDYERPELELPASFVQPVEEGASFANTPWWELFDALEPGEAGIPVEAALQRILGDRGRRGDDLPASERLTLWTEAIRDGWLLPEAIRPALRRLLDESGAAPADVLARYRSPLDDSNLDRIADSIRSEFESLHTTKPESKLRWAMGRLRNDWLGHYRAAVVLDRLQRKLGGPEVTR